MSEPTSILPQQSTCLSHTSEKDRTITVEPKRDTPRIMIVEDDALNLRMLGDVVQSLGYSIIPTRTGRQALELAYLHLPSLILLDMHLPDISGIQVCKELRKQSVFLATPIIAVTVLAHADDKHKALSAGCTEYLVKPVSLDTLLCAISSNIEIPSQSEFI